MLRTRSMIDDTLDVFPAHGMGGITGMIATAVFAADVGLFMEKLPPFFIICWPWLL
jgi:ammonium transporter, Amt family